MLSAYLNSSLHTTSFTHYRAKATRILSKIHSVSRSPLPLSG